MVKEIYNYIESYSKITINSSNPVSMGKINCYDFEIPARKNFFDILEKLDNNIVFDVYKKFLQVFKTKIDKDYSTETNNPLESYKLLRSILVLSKICSSFFDYFEDLSRFSTGDIIRIMIIAKNSGIKNLLIFNYQGLTYSPCINSFLINDSIINKNILVNSLKNISKNNCDIYMDYDSDFYFFDNEYNYYSDEDFHINTRLNLIVLQNILTKHFKKNNKPFDNIKILEENEAHGELSDLGLVSKFLGLLSSDLVK